MSATDEENVCNHIKVVIRVRPENPKERNGNFQKVVQVVDKHILVFDPKVEEVSFFHGKKLPNRDITKRQNKDLKFVFDAIFDEHSTQREIFEDTTKTFLDGFLNGYNCTVLAYGATGAGKTHTMLGSPEDPGVMYLSMVELYNSIDRIKEEKHCAIAVSYLEVYNEQIRDLLVNSGPLAVREDPQKGVFVHGLTLHQPKSADEILQMLDYGNKNRTQHPTDVNASSSRSHAVFQIYLRQQDKTASISQNVRVAKMCLIDLAGSERASATKSKGTILREGANINRSLLALGNVINALADPKRKNQHIPYRNSKLTRLLKDSLGGNCRTIIIAAISPSSLFFDDTYNTLKYANRAKDIKSSISSNVVSLDSHISQYVKICKQQEKEILVYITMILELANDVLTKTFLRNCRSCNAISLFPPICVISITSFIDINVWGRLKETLKCVFANREEIRKEFLKLDLQLKENVLKTHYQKQCHEQVEIVCSCSPERLEKATGKLDHRLALLKSRRLHLEKKEEEVAKRLEDNTNWLHRLENEMRLLGQDGHVPPDLQRDLQCCHLKLEIQDLKTQIEYMKTLASQQNQQYKQTEKILNFSLPVLVKQYIALKRMQLANGVIEDDFRELKQLIHREKAVIWADQIVEESDKNDQLMMSAIMSFPQLVSYRNTPCSNVEKPNLLYGMPLHKRTRRKLMASPLTIQSLEDSSQSCPNPVVDSLSKAFCPITYTPEVCKKPMETLCTGTVIKKVPHMATLEEMSHMAQIQEPLKQSSTEDVTHNVTPELGLPSLLNRQSGAMCAKPSYMAMTSAVTRKRTLRYVMLQVSLLN
uniref:Kinesin-like protein n=1 Tax=Pseudonaja textilis TaxID=8673 RepID=A0A670Y5G2_PSETE